MSSLVRSFFRGDGKHGAPSLGSSEYIAPPSVTSGSSL